jgi:folate-binding protein YgfZ
MTAARLEFCQNWRVTTTGNPSKNNALLSARLDLSRLQPSLGVMRVFGLDSAAFLQGQLSADIVKLPVGSATLAGLHSREGRVLAILRVLAAALDDFWCVLPRERIDTVLAHLRKFVFRAKTVLSDASDAWRLEGCALETIAGGQLVVPWGRERAVVLAPATTPSSSVASDDELARWHAQDIVDGLPQVTAATADSFVSQMLNLDVLGGIAFDKGCYAGQEIIARAHYRGRVKRRMQRFVARSADALVPGTSGTFANGGTFKVVDSIALGDGRTEFLAVTTYGSEPDASATPAGGPDSLAAERLPLPYSLPD